MESRIITIVGGSGFLGRYVVRELARRGFRLRIVCRHPETADALRTCGNLGQISIVAGDITRPETIAPQLAGAYAAVNLVGILYEHGRSTFSAVHAQGAERLAQAAKAAGVSAFVQMSSLGIDKATDSHYAHSKMLGEKAVRAAFPEAILLRPGVLFGPEDHFFNFFARFASLLHMLPAFGGGHTKFQPVYAQDVALAVAACIENPATQGKAFELGGPDVLTFREILAFIFHSLGLRPRIIPVPFPIVAMKAACLELLPFAPLITRDQVRLLHYDNVVSATALTFATLGIQPQSVAAVVPQYLARFRGNSALHPVHA